MPDMGEVYGRPFETGIAMRRYSPAKAARREKSFREHLARKQSPIRFAHVLPDDIDLLDVDWQPTREERLLDRIQDKQECEQQAEPDPS
jgi:hypothetical protein